MLKIMELLASITLEHFESQLWEEVRQSSKEQEKPRRKCKGERSRRKIKSAEVKRCKKGGEEDTFSRRVREQTRSMDSLRSCWSIYLEKRRRILSVKEGESRRRSPACDTLLGPTCESKSEEGYFQWKGKWTKEGLGEAVLPVILCWVQHGPF